MGISERQRRQIINQVQGALALDIAYMGIANGLWSQLAKLGATASEALAAAAGVDAAYVARWCDAAFAFGYLRHSARGFVLTPRGRAFLPDVPGSAMPLAIQAVLSAHMAERAATLMKTGERPGEKVLAERESLLPLFGPMLEANFKPLFERALLPNVAVYREVDARAGTVVDLGCGNGWYLRALAQHFSRLRGIGLDGFDENIRQATLRTQESGLAGRLSFRAGDIYNYTVTEPVDLVAMNRALHHVWDERERVFRILADVLKPGGAAVIWEPNWPASRDALRAPSRRGMAFQNLAEHVQGNHFLRPDEIQDAFRAVGMDSEVHLFAQDGEAVVIGRKR